MDRLYNNEAIVGCVILLLLNSCDMEMARLSIVVPMIINDKLRNRLSRYTDNTHPIYQLSLYFLMLYLI